MASFRIMSKVSSTTMAARVFRFLPRLLRTFVLARASLVRAYTLIRYTSEALVGVRCKRDRREASLLRALQRHKAFE